MTVAELAKSWLRNRRGRVAEASYDRYQRDIDTCLPMIPVRLVARLRPADLSRLEDELLAKGNSKSTVRALVSSIQRMVSWGLAEGLINANPIAGRRAIEVKDSDLMKVRRALSHAECRKLLEASPEPYRSLWLTYLSTGMRREELIRAEFKWINWDEATLALPASSAKSSKERTIPLSADVMLIFRRQRLKYGNTGRIFDVSRCLLYHFYRHCQAAGIADAKPRGSVDVHSLRGTFASHAIESGADPKAIQTILGHATLEMTMNLYCKATESGKRKAIDAMPSLLG